MPPARSAPDRKSNKKVYTIIRKISDQLAKMWFREPKYELGGLIRKLEDLIVVGEKSAISLKMPSLSKYNRVASYTSVVPEEEYGEF